jgi:glycosyltransferase involved in cell wall biosynthesis
MLVGRRWNVPFILSENWTIYYPSDPGYLRTRNYIFQLAVKLVLKNTRRFLPVSKDLNEQVQALSGFLPSTVIPNVVDTNLFHYTPAFQANQPFTFIHISTMSFQKNPEGLLRGFKKFYELSGSGHLCMVGPYPQVVLDYARKIGLDQHIVQFTGPVSYQQVAHYMKVSNAMVLFSRYETLPCVILEALCCGLPVISTPVGGIPEIVNSSNGLLVEDQNEEELTEAFVEMYKKYDRYKRSDIAKNAIALYSYAAVGHLIDAVYSDISVPLR